MFMFLYRTIGAGVPEGCGGTHSASRCAVVSHHITRIRRKIYDFQRLILVREDHAFIFGAKQLAREAPGDPSEFYLLEAPFDDHHGPISKTAVSTKLFVSYSDAQLALRLEERTYD